MSQIIDQSITSVAPITTSDTVNLSFPSGVNRTKGIYVGVAGDVSAVMPDNTTAVFKGLSAGVEHWLSVKRINATGTTATNILALY